MLQVNVAHVFLEAEHTIDAAYPVGPGFHLSFVISNLSASRTPGFFFFAAASVLAFLVDT